MADIRKREGKTGTSWQARYPCKAAKSGYAFKTFRTKKEAREFIENLGSHKTAHRDLKTVPEAVNLWLDICEKEGRGNREPVTINTLKGYRNRARIINEYEWDTELHELTQPDIIAFRSWLKRHHSLYLARRVLSCLHSVFLELNQRGLMSHDPALGVTIQKQSRYDNPVTIPTQAEVKTLLRTADQLARSQNKQTARTWKRYRPMIYLAVSSGMRPQEICALRKQDVLDDGIQVTQAVDKSGKIGPPKTKAGRRFIPVSEIALELVRRYIAQNDHECDLVFPTSTGKPQLVDTFRSRAWYPLMEAAGLMVEKKGKDVLQPKFVPYALRHFFASKLIQKRTNLKRLQKIMGHADIQITLDTYGHIIDDIDAREAHESKQVLAEILGNSRGKSVANAA